MTPSERRRIQSVGRAVALLRALSTMAPSEATLGALAERCRLNRSTAWRLLATLRHYHFVEFDQATNSYGIGFAAFHLGGTGIDSLVRRAHPALIELSAGDRRVSFAAPQGLALVHVDVDRVISPNVLLATWRWRQVALHATSTGKAYLAWLPRDEVALVLPARLERYTSTTLVTQQALRNELARTRERGFAIGRGEYKSMLSGVSAPVLNATGRPVAVVCVWGSGSRVREDGFAALGALVMEAAEELARELGLS